VVLGHFGAPLTPTQVTMALAAEMGFSWASDAAFDVLDCNSLASGDVDVMNTTIQLVLPCLDQITVLAAVTKEPIALVPDAPTVSQLAPSLDIALWNGIFVRKETPQDVRDKIAAVVQQTIASPRAQEIAAQTGAQLYWQPAEEAKAQIAADIETSARIAGILGK
jgi:tripartite-type tricarboxylate transporter receptor subunit TctC